jgi:hypothetical protein
MGTEIQEKGPFFSVAEVVGSPSEKFQPGARRKKQHRKQKNSSGINSGINHKAESFLKEKKNEK